MRLKTWRLQLKDLAFLNVVAILFVLFLCRYWENPKPIEMTIKLEVPNTKNIGIR